MLGWIGIGPIPWLIEPHWAMVSLCLVSVWKSVRSRPSCCLPRCREYPRTSTRQHKSTARGELRRFFSITVPLIRGALSFVLVISIINSVQAFDQVYVLTGGHGGPETGTYVFGIMMFQNAFAFGDVGYASALAWLIFAILLVLTVIQLWIARRNATEE